MSARSGGKSRSCPLPLPLPLPRCRLLAGGFGRRLSRLDGRFDLKPHHPLASAPPPGLAAAAVFAPNGPSVRALRESLVHGVPCAAQHAQQCADALAPGGSGPALLRLFAAAEASLEAAEAAAVAAGPAECWLEGAWSDRTARRCFGLLNPAVAAARRRAALIEAAP